MLTIMLSNLPTASSAFKRKNTELTDGCVGFSVSLEITRLCCVTGILYQPAFWETSSPPRPSKGLPLSTSRGEWVRSAGVEVTRLLVILSHINRELVYGFKGVVNNPDVYWATIEKCGETVVHCQCSGSVSGGLSCL